MSPPWIFGGGPGNGFSHACERHLLVSVMCEVALDGEREFGGVAVADDAAKLPVASSTSGGGPAPHISPNCQRFTLRLVRQTISKVDSHGLVDCSVALTESCTRAG